MPTFPKPITDTFEAANRTLRGGSNTPLPGFIGSTIPSSASNPADRLLPADRPAVFTRNLVQWFVPETGVVEMYVNPQSISYQFKKHITNQRTKGGYLLQYWGEDLTQLSIQGTTGSSGIEGINVLHDIYRSEQISFDPYALALASDRDAELNDQFSFLGDFPDDSLGGLLTGFGESFTDLVSNAIETGETAATRAQPTLASLAFSVEMYYSGWVFRGYFTDFRIDERADRLGLFDYSITFMVTQRRGVRPNFLAWHRQPNGPSNTDPVFGRPYSYAGLATEQPSVPGRQNQNDGITIADALLQPLEGLVGAASRGFSSIF